jgi:hypothetical protein
MTIENPQRFMAGIWDWGCLRGCFGDTRIEPTDIDGLVERKGHFLLLETKAPTAQIKGGQEIMFQALRATKRFTVLVIWGDAGQPQRGKLYCVDAVSRIFDCDLQTLRAIVAYWFDTIESGSEIAFTVTAPFREAA